ncbi:MAG: GTP cyclohydrolase I FolE [Hyphomicrobiaceae bacterium]
MSQTKPLSHLTHSLPSNAQKPSRSEAEAAVRTLLAWAGEDPDREALRDTPSRVVEAYLEYFRGYNEDPVAWLADSDIQMSRSYDDMILLTGIRVQSFCEHHMTPFEGTASIAYVPDRRIIGLSRLARVVDTYARRLQTQESLTAQIGWAIQTGLEPLGVAILISAEHQCVSFRGIRQSGLKTLTSRFTGAFDNDPSLRSRFLTLSGHEHSQI